MLQVSPWFLLNYDNSEPTTIVRLYARVDRVDDSLLVVQDLWMADTTLALKMEQDLVFDSVWATEAGVTVEIIADWRARGVAFVLQVQVASDENILNLPHCAHFIYQRIKHVLEIRDRENLIPYLQS